MTEREIAYFYAQQAEVGKWDLGEVLAYVGMAICALFIGWLFHRFGISSPVPTI